MKTEHRRHAGLRDGRRAGRRGSGSRRAGWVRSMAVAPTPAVAVTADRGPGGVTSAGGGACWRA